MLPKNAALWRMRMKRKKVLLKGAGDLATGIACRLHRSGFPVIMTEIPEPTTVRRSVAFSRAVYDGRAQVEGITGILCSSLPESEAAIEQNQIAVLVDPQCEILEQWRPDVLVDAIIGKRNQGTSIRDAWLVIGIGPGFTAGKDCHAVIESQRGHDLGRCIWSGSAVPNTGIPGSIHGYGIERLLKSEADGIFYGIVSIGDLVEAGTVVAYTGEIPIQAQIRGIVRGLLQDGIGVYKGMKVGDIDPRCQKENCYTVSDKASSIAGGVLEAILSMEVKAGE